MSETVVLIDDDPDFTDELSEFLEYHGLACRAVNDPKQVMPVLQNVRPDLLLLDQNMGPVNGTDVLRTVRAESDVACVILTGMQDPVDRILGLELGADDYIHKTAMPREILARVRAVLRRVKSTPSLHNGKSGRGGWDFRIPERELYSPDGSRCHLTSAEFALLRALNESRGEPLSRELLTEQVFGRQYRAGDRAIDGLIVRLRRKLEPDPDAPMVIKSVRQQGYVFGGFAPTQP